MKKRFLILAIIWLSSCQFLVVGKDDNVNKQLLYKAPVGSLLKLNTELTILANEVGVYLQNGQVQNYHSVNKYDAYCKFELRNLNQQPQVVNPDTLLITKILRETEYVAAGKVQVASLLMSHGDPMAEIYSTLLFLQSDKQKNILKLTCEHWDDPVVGDDLTVTQVKTALGDIFTFKFSE